jgi:hypothetical protein
MKRTTATRAAALAATLLAAGLATAAPAAAADAHTAGPAAVRITSQEQLRANIMKAAAGEDTVCGAGATLSAVPMGGYPPPPVGTA